MAFPVWLIGVLLAVVSAIISNLGLNLQKRNHLNNTRTVEAAQQAKKKEGRAKGGAGGDKPHHHHHHHHHHRHHHHHPHRRRSVAERAAAKKHRVQPSDILIKHRTDSEDEQQQHTDVHKASGKKRRRVKKAVQALSEGEKLPLLDIHVHEVQQVHQEHSPELLQHQAASSAPSHERAHPALLSSASAEGEVGGVAALLSSSSSYLDHSLRVEPPSHVDGVDTLLPHTPSSTDDGSAAPSAAAVAAATPSSSSHKNADDAADSINYTRQLTWQCGLALVILGSLFDFAALAFASQSQIAPLGSLTLVSNVFLAPLLLKEKLSRRDVVCTLVIVAGAALAVLCAAHDDATLTMQEMFGYFLHYQFVLYAVIVVAVVLALRVMTWKAGVLRRRAHTSRDAAQRYVLGMKFHRFGYAAAAGIMGAQSVLFAKCTSTLFRATIAGDGLMFVYPGTYAVLGGLAVTIFFQIRWLNSGLRLFPALYVVPVFQSFWILVSVLSGMIFFQEWEGVLNEPLNAVGFCTGLMLTIGGVYVLSQRAGHEPADDEQHKAEEQLGHEEPTDTVDVTVDGLLRRDSLSSSSSFDALAPLHPRSRSLSGDRDFDDVHQQQLNTPHGQPLQTPVSMMKQPLLGEEKEKAAHPTYLHVSTPSRSRRSHHNAPSALSSPTNLSSPSAFASTPVSAASPSAVPPFIFPYHPPPHHAHPLSPLPEVGSPSSSSHARPRLDSDPVERHRSTGRAESAPQPAQAQHRPVLGNLLPPTVEIEPVLPSHSFSHANEFLYQSPSPKAVQLRRARSASIGHVGEDVQKQLRLQQALKGKKKPLFQLQQALSALVSPPLPSSDSAHFRRPDWQELSRTAAMNAPGLSAFAHAFALRNYERVQGEREEEGGERGGESQSPDDSASDSSSSSSNGSSGGESEEGDEDSQPGNGGHEEEDEEKDDEEAGHEGENGHAPVGEEEKAGGGGGRVQRVLAASASPTSSSARQPLPSPAVLTASTAAASSSSSFPAPALAAFRPPVTSQHRVRVPTPRRAQAG